LDFFGDAAAEGELGQGSSSILLGEGVNLLALTSGDGNGFDGADGLGTVGQNKVLDLSSLIAVNQGLNSIE